MESLRVIIKLSDGSSSIPSSSVFIDDELDRAASKIGQKQPSNSDKQVFTIIFSLKENSNMRVIKYLSIISKQAIFENNNIIFLFLSLSGKLNANFQNLRS